jgi:hypothetical protein
MLADGEGEGGVGGGGARERGSKSLSATLTHETVSLYLDKRSDNCKRGKGGNKRGRYSVYLLYWYESTNTDAGVAEARLRRRKARRSLRVIAVRCRLRSVSKSCARCCRLLPRCCRVADQCRSEIVEASAVFATCSPQ